MIVPVRDITLSQPRGPGPWGTRGGKTRGRRPRLPRAVDARRLATGPHAGPRGGRGVAGPARAGRPGRPLTGPVARSAAARVHPAGEPGADRGWRPVVLVEVSPHRLHGAP